MDAQTPVMEFLQWWRSQLCRCPTPMDGSKTSSLKSLYTVRCVTFSSFLKSSPKPSLRAKVLLSYRAFPPNDAVAQGSGQWTESQAGKFGHLVGPCMDFLRGMNKDAIVASEGLLIAGNLSMRWGKSCHTHTTSMSQIPNSQHRLQSESMGTAGWRSPLYWSTLVGNKSLGQEAWRRLFSQIFRSNCRTWAL